jgi:hypothetical protein
MSLLLLLFEEKNPSGLMLEDQMNEFSVNFERLITGTFAKGSEHLKINSLYFYKYVVHGQRGYLNFYVSK